MTVSTPLATASLSAQENADVALFEEAREALRGFTASKEELLWSTNLSFAIWGTTLKHSCGPFVHYRASRIRGMTNSLELDSCETTASTSVRLSSGRNMPPCLSCSCRCPCLQKMYMASRFVAEDVTQ